MCILKHFHFLNKAFADKCLNGTKNVFPLTIPPFTSLSFILARMASFVNSLALAF